MDIEVIIAIIASITALVVAVVGLVTAIINNKHSARTAKSIEELRFEFSQTQARDTLSNTHLDEVLGALVSAIQAIQLVKDEIQMILSAPEDSLDASSAIHRIERAREKIFACYEEKGAILSEWETVMVHRAKNISLSVEYHMKEGLRNKDSASLLPEGKYRKIFELRAELTDIQQSLRDSRTDRLLRRIGNGER